jgi:tetratricopeptide (TPR) repeat protein
LEQFEPYRVASAVLDRSGRAVARLELSAEMIEALPLTVIDDLIDRGLFTGSASQVHLRSARSPDRGYLALRVDPGSATDEQLAGPGGDAERSRRHVVECLAEGAEPSSGPAATMVALRSGRPVSGNEINALPVGWRATARELSEFLTTGDLGLAEQLAVDPTVLPVIAERLAGESQSLPRSGRLADLRARGYLEDALSAVLEARWEDALNSAREVLGSSNREDLRDEALNLLACAQWQLGDDERAINALREALEGEYNASLQANIGVVAENLEPELAAEHLARLASEAPTVKSRHAAVMRGFGLWSRDQDEDDESPLPAPLRDAFRNIAQSDVESGELSNSDFWSLAGVLAFHDSDWLRTNMTAPAGLGVGGRLGASTGGRLARSPRAQMVDLALARSVVWMAPEKLNEYIEAVGGLNVPDSAWCAERQEEAGAVALRITANVLTSCSEQAEKLFEFLQGKSLHHVNVSAVREEIGRIRGFIQGSIRLLNRVRPWTDDPVKLESLERLLEFSQGFDNDLAGALP